MYHITKQNPIRRLYRDSIRGKSQIISKSPPHSNVVKVKSQIYNIRSVVDEDQVRVYCNSVKSKYKSHDSVLGQQINPKVKGNSKTNSYPHRIQIKCKS